MAIEGALQALLPINKGPVLYTPLVVYGLSQQLLFAQWHGTEDLRGNDSWSVG